LGKNQRAILKICKIKWFPHQPKQIVQRRNTVGYIPSASHCSSIFRADDNVHWHVLFIDTKNGVILSWDCVLHLNGCNTYRGLVQIALATNISNCESTTMAELIEKIPLFPLGIVLFPGSFYPLHIFEEKYKTLVNKCINENTYFGVNLINSDKMFNVGCTAKIAKVLAKFDDGRMDVMISGGRRYSMHSVNEHEKPYYTANVEYFDDIDSTQIDPDLFDECVGMYNKVMEVIYNGEGELFLQHTYAGEANLSFLMAQKAGLTINQKQDILEMRSENQRLKYLHSHLGSVIPKIREAEQIQKVISMDGYFRP